MKSNIMNKYLQLVILSVLPYQLHTQGLGHGLGQGQGRGPGMWRGQGHGGGRGWGQGQGQGQGQGVRCPTSCEIGQTCAMVRHGNNPPAPGCISMQEAILLNQALNGAPTGPGTGITLGQSRQQQTPSFNFQPQQNFNTPPAPPQTIPGVNFLGDGVLGRRFEDRFRSAAGPQPIPQQGGVWRQPDGFNGVLPGSINQDQSIPPGFIDPTVGDPFRNRGFGVDGGLNTRHSHASHGNSIRDSRSGGFNRNTNPWNAFSGGGGNTPVTSRNEFPGETQNPNGIPFNTERVGQSTGRVSSILNDTVGYYYMFYQTPSSTGRRVGITKNGLCTRYDVPSDSSDCVIACTSDDQCRGDFKCCPTGCTLGCMPPYREAATSQSEQQQPQMIPSSGPTGPPPVSDGNGSCDRRCTAQSQCGELYCYYKPGCAGRVCQPL